MLKLLPLSGYFWIVKETELYATKIVIDTRESASSVLSTNRVLRNTYFYWR